MNNPLIFLNGQSNFSLLGFGKENELILNSSDSIDLIDEFIKKNKDQYIFCALSFELKNRFENLQSTNFDGVNFPELILFTTQNIVKIKNNEFQFLKGESNSENIQFVHNFLKEINSSSSTEKNTIDFQFRISKYEYLKNIEKLKKHIHLGDIYETNFCQEIFAENCELKDPLKTYSKINKVSQAPFSVYLSFNEFEIMGGSPERFIKKVDNKIISQPIKGTAKRGVTLKEDQKLIENLQNDPKERSENVMIVDLVRNDLSRIAKKGTVNVDELCKIYSFETVHQMISTISCDIEESTPFSKILEATFPMGSMTGVPKIKALELTNQYESFNRGLYSGSIGYISPNGDFDLNVVIRTIIYNKERKYLSCGVGSAITNRSIAQNEYEECLIKIQKIIDAVNK